MNGPHVVEQHLDTAVGRVVVWHARPPGSEGAAGGGASEPGGRRPVVYLHSAAGEDGNLAAPFFEAAAAGGRLVVAPMFPGFAGSEGLGEIEDIEDAVYHLMDVLDRLGLAADPPHLVGLSLGGWMAVELAARYPERVRTLTLVNSAGLYLAASPIGEIFGRQLDELAADVFGDQSHPVAQVMRQMAAAQRADVSSVPFELIRPFLEAQAATAKLAWNPYLHDPKLPKLLGRVQAPTLVVAGGLDRLIPRAHSEAYAAAVAGARLEVVPGAGHMLTLEAPGELAALVEAHAARAEGAHPV